MGLVLVSSALLAAHGGSLEITLAPAEATVAGLRRRLASLGLAVDPRTWARPRLMHGGLDRVVSDCHFAVQLNRFIPGFLSYSVAVFLK